jgi:hypothetical protein
MSLPGLGLAEPEQVTKVESAQHELAKGWEWRFEVAAEKYISLKVSIKSDDQKMMTSR